MVGHLMYELLTHGRLPYADIHDVTELAEKVRGLVIVAAYYDSSQLLPLLCIAISRNLFWAQLLICLDWPCADVQKKLSCKGSLLFSRGFRLLQNLTGTIWVKEPCPTDAGPNPAKMTFAQSGP
jgi:hypothetical protein